MMRACLTLLAAIGLACDADVIEMDSAFESRAALCADFECDSAPRCADGSNTCLACLCCPCTQSETRCDPDHPSVRWQCIDGCFIDDPCPTAYQTCSLTDGIAICEAGAVDCERLAPYELIHICGVTDSLCAQCACYDCSDIGGTGVSFCDNFRPAGDINAVLSCEANDGCLLSQPCGSARCIEGFDWPPIAGCNDQITCAEVGCTGLPLCSQSSGTCGECGCCTVSGVNSSNTCALASDGSARHVRLLYDSELICFHEQPCAADEFCAFDITEQPFCFSK